MGCARAPIKSAGDSMRLSKKNVTIADDLGFADLSSALAKNIATLQKSVTLSESPAKMKFGNIEITKSDYVKALLTLQDALSSDPTGELFKQALAKNFDLYEVFGDPDWAQVFITSYYEPVIEGRLTKTKKFSQPIYGIPKDMILVDMPEFAKAFPDLAEYQREVISRKWRDGYLRGRLDKSNTDSIKILPYYTRKEIDEDLVIRSKAAVLAWVDPIDSFFLQIQGSGRVRLGADLEIKLGYASQNGHPYFPIGKLLLDRIPKEKISSQKIKAHLRTLKPKEAQAFMSQNPSYVFFRVIETEPITYSGAEVLPGRTIATDPLYFPKGALAFLEYDKPKLAGTDTDEVVGIEPASRLVFDQDTGGAIRGPARVDLFWGRGKEAEQMSGVMRQRGSLYYFVPKPEFLANLSGSEADIRSK